MKALYNISIVMLLTLGSCSPSLYTGAEYDDLYYSASDQPVVKERIVVNEQLPDNNSGADSYYDNIYSSDTLLSNGSTGPNDYDDQIIVNNNVGGNGYNYYDDSYSGRLSMFYGNYFNPYWQDPFYFNFGYGYPSYGFNFGIGFGFGFGYGYYGYPYYYGYNPYYWDPFPYYGYGCCYPYYGGYYPYYPYYPSEGHYTSYGRRERPSNLSSNYNENMGYGRRSGNLSTTGTGTSARRANTVSESATSQARRSSADVISRTQTSETSGIKTDQEAIKSESTRSSVSGQRTQAGSKPEYRNSNRSYTPSYNSPRMSTRPSYNNSRVSDGTGRSVGTGNTRSFNSSAPVRSSSPQIFNNGSGNSQRSNPSFNNSQRRFNSPTSSTRQYSVPSSRSSSGGGRSYSSGSFNSSSSHSVSSGGSRSSYSSGSSSGSSGSSFSSHSSGRR